MAQSNHERVGRALEHLREGLRPFVERRFQDRYGDEGPAQALQALRNERDGQAQGGEPRLDVHALLSLMWARWEEVFRSVLGSVTSTSTDARGKE